MFLTIITTFLQINFSYSPLQFLYSLAFELGVGRCLCPGAQTATIEGCMSAPLAYKIKA